MVRSKQQILEQNNEAMARIECQNRIDMCLIHNEGNYVVAERFIKTLNNKIYKCLTSKSKNVYVDKLHDIMNKYSNTAIRIMEQLK